MKPENQDKNSKEIGIGVGVGIALGTALGAAFGNVGLGHCSRSLIGAALGRCVFSDKRRRVSS